MAAVRATLSLSAGFAARYNPAADAGLP